jgi:uncharacterized phiE125 gp8 family phage protein
MGPLVLVTPPAIEPVTVAEAKDWARITTSAEDDVVEMLLLAARRQVESTELRRALNTQTWDYFLDAFPCDHGGRIRVPRPPLQSVTSIKYIDTGGAQVVLAASEYQVDAKSQPGRVYPAWGKSWPATRDVPNAVELRFVAGYGNAIEDVPEEIRQAIKVMVNTGFQNREEIVTGTIVAAIPITMAARSLLAPYRIAWL